MEIRAAVSREINGIFSVETLNLDDPRDDEVLVKLTATGICHTDLAIVKQLMPVPLPIVLGHEGAGVVEKVGAGVSKLKPGDTVVLTFNTCGECGSCINDHPAYCDLYPALNFATGRLDGSSPISDTNGDRIGAAFFSQSSFATYAITSARNTIKVRADAPLELLGPLGCGLSTGAGAVLNVLKPRKHSTLAVFGVGAVGFGALMAAKIAGVEKIVAIDKVTSRLELARDVGATDTIVSSKGDTDEALTELEGLDYAIDTSGVPIVIESAVRGLKEGGECILLGANAPDTFKVDLLPFIPGKVLRGVVNGDCVPDTFIPQLVDYFMEGQFPLEKISKLYPLDKINEAVADSNSGKTIKPILKMA